MQALVIKLHGYILHPRNPPLLSLKSRKNQPLSETTVSGARGELQASVNPPHTNYQDGEPNRSEGPLALAAEDDEDDVIRLLLEQGANVNQRLGDKMDNSSALAEAMYSGSPSTVYLLLTHGADPNSVLGPGGSLPHILTFYPQPRWVAVRKLLVQYGLKIPAGH